MGKQFTDLSGNYGAPMGRAEFGTPEQCEMRSVRLFAVSLDMGGYDDGGAYWGCGLTLYCATDDCDYRQFTRAKSRAHAALLLDLDPGYLKVGLTRVAWGRYSATEGYFGRAAPGFEITEFGKVVAYADDWSELCTFAQSKGDK